MVKKKLIKFAHEIYPIYRFSRSKSANFIHCKASLSPKLTKSKGNPAVTSFGNKSNSLSTSKILSAPKLIPTPERPFNPKRPVQASYRPPPQILPILTPKALTSKIAPV